MKAATVSRDGTANMEPNSAFALYINTFPYACASNPGSAIAGWLENLSVSHAPSYNSPSGYSRDTVHQEHRASPRVDLCLERLPVEEGEL
jgi:hypothetical protein